MSSTRPLTEALDPQRLATMSDAEVAAALDLDAAGPPLAETVAQNPRTRSGAPRSGDRGPDAYLLGAGLHEILTKRPPHLGTFRETARRGLARTIEKVIDFELARGAPQAAASALAELTDAPEPLRARVRAGLEGRAAEKQQLHELRSLRADLDPTTGSGTRTAVAVVLGSRGQSLRRSWRGSARTPIPSSSRTCPRWSASPWAGQLALQVGGHMIGLSWVASQTLLLLVWGLAASFAASIEPRSWVAVGGFFVGFLVACRWPELRWDAMSAAILVLAGVYLYVWRKPAGGPRDRR